MEVERLDRNHWFKVLSNSNDINMRLLWHYVMENSTSVLLCVPQSVSLRGSVTVEDMKNHILRRTEFTQTPGLFQTVNNKLVRVRGTTIQAGARFQSEGRLVHILCSEEFTVDQSVLSTNEQKYIGTKITVVQIDRPLQGGAKVPCALIEYDEKQVLNVVRLLMGFPHCQPLFHQLDHFCDVVLQLRSKTMVGRLYSLLSRFHQDCRKWWCCCARTKNTDAPESSHQESNNVTPLLSVTNQSSPIITRTTTWQMDSESELDDEHPFDSITPPLEHQIRRKVHDTVEAMLECNDLMGPHIEDQHEFQKVQLQLAAESYIMRNMYHESIEWMRTMFRIQDTALDSTLDRLVLHRLERNHDLAEELGIRPEYRFASLDKATAELLELPSLTTPLNKLLCLKRVINEINSCIEQSVVASTVESSRTMNSEELRNLQGELQLTTDDLLDQLVLVLVNARSQGLGTFVSEIQFIRRFHYLNLDTSILGFYLANVEVAVEWFLTKGTAMAHSLQDMYVLSSAPEGLAMSVA